jgi:general L-amino acid transport system permease protein
MAPEPAVAAPPASPASPAPPAAGSWFGDPQVRGIAFQILVLGGVIGLGWFLLGNALDNLERQSIATGFGFMTRPASFAIGESMIAYSAADSYLMAVLVGVLNTLKVTLIGIVLATLLGAVTGIARLSRNWLVARLATAYVELVRNIPLLLQLFLWYAIITESLPGPRQALQLGPGFYLCNRGLIVPALDDHPVWTAMGLALLLGVAASLWLGRWARRRQAATGRTFPVAGAVPGLILGLPLAVWLGFGAPLAFSMPVMGGFNFRGGLTFTPELSALVLGLVIYTATFIAEIVRSGILAVNKGQTEAGLSLGLSRTQVLRLIILPQAMRVIVPPVASEYSKLIKNTSLAVAIGYPDVVSILNTMVNQTGQAIEGVSLIMAVFLAISLTISAFMNWYNRHIALVER